MCWYASFGWCKSKKMAKKCGENEKFVHKTEMHFNSTFTRNGLIFLKAFFVQKSVREKKSDLTIRFDAVFIFFDATISVHILRINDKVCKEIGRNKFKIENMQTTKSDGKSGGRGYEILKGQISITEKLLHFHFHRFSVFAVPVVVLFISPFHIPFFIDGANVRWG